MALLLKQKENHGGQSKIPCGNSVTSIQTWWPKHTHVKSDVTVRKGMIHKNKQSANITTHDHVRIGKIPIWEIP